jgi:NAD(P)-dependent dehydrogenase (short-subunit alcohol dehydrogenase family)
MEQSMVFFVTGGSRGIGAAIVLAAIEEGHQVAFTYRENEEKARQVVEQARALREEARCRAYRLDVRDPQEVERVGDQVLEDFETVEVVVNNAAINRDNLAVSMSDEEWHEVIATNLSGPFYVCRYFLTTMLANRFGRIINISSVSATGSTGQANYAAAKAGLSGLTRSLAKEYGPKGITANVVIPGFFDTEMTRTTMSEESKFFWLKYCPKRRVGETSEVSRVVTFLASEAAGFVNGAEIPVTGGLDHAP